MGVHFSYNLYESEKVIKVYSVTFSLIYEHEKEQNLSSEFFLKNSKRICTCDKCIKANPKNVPMFNIPLLDLSPTKNKTLVTPLEV
jgi:epoxyqueuosine reductase QueG